MKKAYILISIVFLITLVSFLINLSFNISSYIPRILRDEYYYIQARILSLNAKELAKYFLYKAKQEGKECINFINFNYPKDDDIVRIDYFYPIAECDNFKFKSINQDANLSKDGVIIINISIRLNSNQAVNDEIFINKKDLIYTNQDFWKSW
ncbi:hypothetical protein DU472_00590 [Campylobacter novaezeelandiae]|uniref:Periplasmic protein n=1 Tax=Campylobacter novaezeelandiae TaxID=2267891 RepID=A0A4Q9JUY3_9BACT|nr:hypothetical protein [Campylobacter novaezeelandiae]TBR81153.1 hypothetical protein DU473_04950 [Campylobacter novaezeelandiae]TBR82676.1 hypothetical protein DU472_00590 [Campylobacter novaezeelandiae]